MALENVRFTTQVQKWTTEQHEANAPIFKLTIKTMTWTNWQGLWDEIIGDLNLLISILYVSQNLGNKYIVIQ